MKGVTTQGNTKGKIGLLERLRGLPLGTLVPAEAILDELASDAGALESAPQGKANALPSGIDAPENPPPQSWRTLLWTAPAECRIGREELAEAVARPRSWVYRHTQAKSAHRIPHRKLDGELVFLVGEVRAWLKDQEEIIQAGPLDCTPPRLRALP
jgi:hypothetical protein